MKAGSRIGWVSVGVVWLILIVLGAAYSQAAEPEIPDGWTVSPHNTEGPGQAGFTILHEPTGLELIYVPAGEFSMGSSEGLKSEGPAHTVALAAYWIGRTEVSVRQWRMFKDSLPEGNNQGDNHPVMGLTWASAKSFCEKFGLRLPTEAEWEYAARGSKGAVFPWGDAWDDRKCCNAKNPGAGGTTMPVGECVQDVTWCGAHDMAGNAREWVLDWYDPSYYENSPTANPAGPARGMVEEVTLSGPSGPMRLQRAECHVLRGGGFWQEQSCDFMCFRRYPGAELTIFYSDIYPNYSMLNTGGIRCARNAD